MDSDPTYPTDDQAGVNAPAAAPVTATPFPGKANVVSGTHVANPSGAAGATWSRTFRVAFPTSYTPGPGAIIKISAMDPAWNAYICSAPTPDAATANPQTTSTTVTKPGGVANWPSTLIMTVAIEFPVNVLPETAKA